MAVLVSIYGQIAAKYLEACNEQDAGHVVVLKAELNVLLAQKNLLELEAQKARLDVTALALPSPRAASVTDGIERPPPHRAPDLRSYIHGLSSTAAMGHPQEVADP